MHMPEVRDNRVKIKPTKPSFTKEQRAGFFLVVGSGCLAVILGFVYLFDHLSDPFSVQYEGPRFLSAEQEQQEEMLRQQQTDTDGDELTDYDELYKFKTSPYLADTDGDGYNDYVELQNGTDPTCAVGQECLDVYEVSGIEQDQVSAYLESLSSSGQALEDVTSLLQSYGPDEIRQLLVEAGVPEEQLAEIPDEDLQALFQSVLGDLEGSGELQQLIENAFEQVQ